MSLEGSAHNKWLLECRERVPGHLNVEDKYHVRCPDGCNGFLDVLFTEPTSDWDQAKRAFEEAVEEGLQRQFRFRRWIPFEEPDIGWLSQIEDYDPTPTFRSDILSEKLGIELYLKNELVMPTGTWKDREGMIFAYRLWRNGVNKVVVFSSGNTGTSCGRTISKMGQMLTEQGREDEAPHMHLVVPDASRNRVEGVRKKFFDDDFVTVHYHAGSNDECAAYTRTLADEIGGIAEGGFSNYARREGLVSFGLEYIFDFAAERGSVDWYAQPIAGGIGIYSMDLAHLRTGLKPPRMLGVQADICSPMVNAWEDDSPTLDERHIPQDIVPSDYVRVLRTRAPRASYPILYNIMKRVDGEFVSVTSTKENENDGFDNEIHEALQMFYEEPEFRRLHEQGIEIGLEPATALAGVVKAVRNGTIEPNSRVLLNVSGAAKPGDIKPYMLDL